MGVFEEKDICEVTNLENDEAWTEALAAPETHIQMIPSPETESSGVLKSHSGDFLKWLKENSPDVKVTMPQNVKKAALHSGDIWLPLVVLANDMTLSIYLNLVSSYLYDQLRASFHPEKARVHLSAVYEDKKAGIIKKFEFSGTETSLKNTIKKFDLNDFMK